MSKFAGLLAATMIILSPRAPTQESIRVDVNLVTVSFSVRDTNGALVDNLTKDDFDVIEDAVPQKIAHFARSLDVPLTLGLIVDTSGSHLAHLQRSHNQSEQVAAR